MGSTGSSSPATTTKRVVVGLGLLVISGLGPWAFLMLLGWPNVANAAVVPGMALTILCITGTGWRAGILIVGPFAVLSGLAVWALPSPWLAAIVLAVAAFVRGYAAREGLHDALILTVIAMGFLVTTPPQFTSTVPAPIVVVVERLKGTALGIAFTLLVMLALLPLVKHLEAKPPALPQ